MRALYKNKPVWALSILLAALITFISLTGWLRPDMYAKETPNWATQSLGQDMVDLFVIMPSLVISAWLMYKGKKGVALLWGGVLFYLIYTFSVYCFGLHLNSLFIFYCLTLGLSFYLFIYFLLTQSQQPAAHWFSHKTPVYTTGIYLIAIAGIFYLLWLSELIPAAVQQTTPKAVEETGLQVNPIHVLDLSVCLPALVITGILLLKRHSLGYLLAPVLLVFCILMDITIGVLAALMYARRLAGNWTVAIVMTVLALASFVLLVRFMKSINSRALTPADATAYSFAIE